MNLGIASVASITVISFLAGYIWKNATKLDDKWIPCVCGTLGLILGVVAYYVGVKDFPADDVITAAAVGVVSGFAATGIHQIPKQLLSSKASDDETPEANPEEYDDPVNDIENIEEEEKPD